MLLLQRRIGFQRPDYQNRGTQAVFLSVPEISLLCLPITFFSSPYHYYYCYYYFLYFFFWCMQVPKYPAWPSTAPRTSRVSGRTCDTVEWVWTLRYSSKQTPTPILFDYRGVQRGDKREGEWDLQQHADAQSGEQDHRHRRLQYARGRISNFPTKWRSSTFLTVPLCVAALTMQILKPAGFADTAHYPLLLLVWVWIHVACPKSMHNVKKNKYQFH